MKSDVILMWIVVIGTFFLAVGCRITDAEPSLKVGVYEAAGDNATVVDFWAESRPPDTVWWEIQNRAGLLQVGTDMPSKDTLWLHRVVVLNRHDTQLSFTAWTTFDRRVVKWEET